MKIIQIVAAHIEQGSEPCVYGLGDDGMLYEWCVDFQPMKGQEAEYVPWTEPDDKSKPRPWNIRTVDNVLCVPSSKYKDTFRDGWTAGWKCLGNQMSKPVCHPEDPTRAERS